MVLAVMPDVRPGSMLKTPTRSPLRTVSTLATYEPLFVDRLVVGLDDLLSPLRIPSGADEHVVVRRWSHPLRVVLVADGVDSVRVLAAPPPVEMIHFQRKVVSHQ